MVKRRLKKEVKIGLIGIGILVIGVFILINFISYRNSLSYKLKKIGYAKEEITYIKANLEKEEQSKLLTISYNHNTLNFMKEKYFLFKNLERYLSYYAENEEKDFSEIVSLVNVNRDRDFYTDTKSTDTSLKDAILVNKYYYLEEDYDAGNIEKISLQYAYANNSIKDEVYDAFIEMWTSAKEEGITLIINSSYREYTWQEKVYENYKSTRGEAYADTYAARPGYSEHQTGLALDIASYPANYKDFEDTEAYQWLLKNSYKYGFILRYPKGKENITGYNFEPWHYRYLGIELAKKVHDSGLTYDEYYAFYLEK